MNSAQEENQNEKVTEAILAVDDDDCGEVEKEKHASNENEMGTTVTAPAETPTDKSSSQERQHRRSEGRPRVSKRGTYYTKLKRQSRQRLVLFILYSVATFFFVGAALAFGPMQLMVRFFFVEMITLGQFSA